MRDFRMAVGNSLKEKIAEHGFFLIQIIDITYIIEKKHFMRDYPLNNELDKLNYFFSAYLNTIQSLKDACKNAMGVSFSWRDLSPTYGPFINFCRNATTHDGTHLIKAGKGTKNYINGPLRRVDNHNKVIKIDPPKEDVCTLCCNLSHEALNNIKVLLNNKGSNIPTANEADFKKGIKLAIESDLIPEEFRKMIKENSASIESSFNGVEVDVVRQTLDAIEAVEGIIVNSRT